MPIKSLCLQLRKNPSMNSQQRYRVYDPTIASEIFDNEVVIVNLLSGNYYSLTGAAAPVWERLIGAYTIEEVVLDLQEIYGPGILALTVRQDVEAFVESLLGHLLLAENPQATHKVPVEIDRSVAQTYAPPAIEVFQDMQDILLLDPVHDVNDLGWPTKISAPETPQDEG